jgi:tRNA threonylcarbamoyladenosine dehydratase
MSEDRFVRLRALVGEEGMARLERAHVAVVGLGAVGSYAVEALARSGVGRLRLVDFDTIRSSNVNRQLHALTSTLGRSKVEAAKERVLDIHPDCRVEALECFAHAETLDRILEGPPHLVIDAIDALTPKVELLHAVAARRLPVVTVTGAALRTDPRGIRVGPLSASEGCPLARLVRRNLRRRGVNPDMPCVYSDEPVDALPPEATDAAAPGEAPSLERGRSRPSLGSLSTLPGMFGLIAAHEALGILLDRNWRS